MIKQFFSTTLICSALLVSACSGSPQNQEQAAVPVTDAQTIANSYITSLTFDNGTPVSSAELTNTIAGTCPTCWTFEYHITIGDNPQLYQIFIDTTNNQPQVLGELTEIEPEETDQPREAQESAETTPSTTTPESQ